MHLFVYGTLKSTANHQLGQLLRRHAELVGTGSIRARLYIIPDPADPTNAYPGAVPSGDPHDQVRGELYAITHDEDGLLAALDDFEHCAPGRPEPYEFVRRRVEVATDRGDLVKATSYLYTWDVSHARAVPGGDYQEDGSRVR